MPPGVAVRQVALDIEEDAGGVAESTEDHQHQARRRQGPGERHDRDHRQPSHAEVHQHGEPREAEAEQRLVQDADQGEPPDQAEERPAPRPVQHPEGERRVAAGDEEVDRHVVHHAQHPLHLRHGYQVVRRGSAVQQHQAGGEDAAGHELPGAAAVPRHPDQHREPHQAGHQRGAMGQAVGEFLASGLGALGGHAGKVAPGDDGGPAVGDPPCLRCATAPRAAGRRSRVYRGSASGA